MKSIRIRLTGLAIILILGFISCISSKVNLGTSGEDYFVPPPTPSFRPIDQPCTAPESQESSEGEKETTSTQLPLQEGVAIPSSLELISTENGHLIGNLARWGMGQVVDIDWSPDGRLIAVSSVYGIYLYDAQTLENLKIFQAKRNESLALSVFSPDSDFIALGTTEGAVRVIQVREGKVVREFKYDGPVIDLRFSPKSDAIGIAISDVGVFVNSIEGGSVIREIPLAANKITISPDFDYVASSSSFILQVWSIHDNTLIREFKEESSFIIISFAFSPDSKTIAIGLFHGWVRLWSLSSGEVINEFNSGIGLPRLSEFSLSGDFLTVAGSSSAVYLYRTSDGHLERVLEGRRQPVAYSPDGKLIAVRSIAGAIALISFDDGNQINAIQNTITGPIFSLAVSPDGNLLAVGGSYIVQIRDLSNGKVICTISAHQNPVFDVQFSPDGTLLASAGSDGVVRLWRLSDGSLIREIKVRNEKGDNIVYDLAFSPDGKSFGVGNSSDYYYSYDIREWELEREFRNSDGLVRSIAFSPDGLLLAVAGSGPIQVLRLEDGKVVGEFWNPLSTRANFSPGGEYLAASGSRQVVVWRLSDGVEIARLAGHTNIVNDFAFSPDGTVIVSAGADNTLRLWNWFEERLLSVMGGHGEHVLIGGIETVAFHPNGKLIFSGGVDGAVFAWGIMP